MAKRKVIKKVVLFAVMLAVLVSTVVFSASAFSFDPATGYDGAFLLINNVRMLPNSSTPLVVANMTNVNVSIPGTSYSRNFAVLRVTVYPQGNGTINFVLDNPNDGYTFAIEAPYNDNVLYYYTTSTTHYSCSYALISYDTLSVVNQTYFDEITIYSDDVIEQEGYDRGQVDGFDDGREQGYQEGYEDGFDEGAGADYQQGFQAGYDEAVGELRETGTKGLFDFCQLSVYYTHQDRVYQISNVPFSVSESGVASFAESYTYIANYLTEQGVTFSDSLVFNGFSFSLVDSGTRLRFLFTDQYYISGDIPSNIQYMAIGYDYDSDAPDEAINPLFRRTVEGVNGWFGFNPNDYQIYVYDFNIWDVSLGDLSTMTLRSNITIFGSQYTLGYQAGVSEGLAGGGNALVNEAVRVARAEGERIGYDRGYAEAFRLAESGGFRELITAVIDVPIHAFRGLLNFELLGVNLFSFVTALITLTIVVIVIKRFI